MPSETTKKVLSNTFYQFFGKAVSMSVTILATIIITRYYGREGYGAFNLMQNFPALFFIVVDFGINAIAVKELAKDWSMAGKYLGNVLILRSVISLVVILVAGIALLFFPYSAALKTGIAIGLFLVLSQALYTSTNIIFQVKFRYDLSTISYISGAFLVLLLTLILSYFKAEVMWVNFSYVLGGFVSFALNMHYLKKLGVVVDFHVDREIIKPLLIQSLPLGLMFVFSQINFKIDSIFISILDLPQRYGLGNTESVAIYGLPYKIFEVSLVVPTFFMNSAYPVLIRHMLEGKERLKATFIKLSVFLFGVGVLFGVIGVLFAPLAIKILGGESFGMSIPVLRILFSGMFLFYSSQPLSWLIVTLGGQKSLPLVYLISAVFNVGANWYFIPKYSFFASSTITLASEAVILILLAFVAARTWKLKYA